MTPEQELIKLRIQLDAIQQSIEQSAISARELHQQFAKLNYPYVVVAYADAQADAYETVVEMIKAVRKEKDEYSK